MAISLLDGGSPQRNGISLGGACRPMKTAFFYRFLSSTKENSEIPSWWLFSEEAKRDMIEAGTFSLSDKTPTIVNEVQLRLRFTVMNALG
ncbi:hypothetical protein YC2023_088686 [Brassica napus]